MIMGPSWYCGDHIGEPVDIARNHLIRESGNSWHCVRPVDIVVYGRGGGGTGVGGRLYRHKCVSLLHNMEPRLPLFLRSQLTQPICSVQTENNSLPTHIYNIKWSAWYTSAYALLPWYSTCNLLLFFRDTTQHANRHTFYYGI